ncbi:MAG: DUF6716 putative glycosyltransferase [Luteolibacter sp.]
MRIAFISTFDSFVRANHILNSALAPHGVEGVHIVMKMRVDQIHDSQIRGILGQQADHLFDLEDTLRHLAAGGYDWVFLGLENASCRRFFEKFRHLSFSGPRPLVATHYPGIIFRHHYDGFSARMPADLVLLNSKADVECYSSLRSALGGGSDNSFCLGPVTVIGCEKFVFQQERKMVLFFDQPSVPHTKEEKTHIFEQLSLLSEVYPGYDFCVKLRVSPKESTLHRGGQATLEILRNFNRNLPPGRKTLGLVDGPPRELIAKSALCLSVSSTALIESIACGCPAVAISDFGVDEEYGVAFFIGSGIIGGLTEIDPGNPPQVSPEWMDRNMEDADARIPQLVACMAAKLAEHRDNPFPPPSIHPFYGSESFHRTAVNHFGMRSALTRRYRRQGSPVKHAVQFTKRRISGLFPSLRAIFNSWRRDASDRS